MREAARPRLTPAALADRAAGLTGGERLAVVGLTRDGVGAALAAGEVDRAALLVAAEDPRSSAAVIDRVLDDLAELALARWPDWPDGAAPDDSYQRPRMLTHRAVEPTRIFDTKPEAWRKFENGTKGRLQRPLVSGPWLKAAAALAASGRPPRFRRMARALECGQLLRVVDPGGVILVAEVDPVAQARAQAVIEALEWCAGHGAACLYALPAEPPGLPPYDRILYGAVAIGRAPAPVAERFIAPRSRAHPASEAERRVEAALARDPELAGLFAGNEVVAVAGDGRQPRVDLVCRRHRLVVEIDGPEHQASPKFGQDRHRDYELLVAGYLVLRLTNDEVADDLQRAVEKIRAMVRLRRLPSTLLPAPGDTTR